MYRSIAACRRDHRWSQLRGQDRLASGTGARRRSRAAMSVSSGPARGL